MIPEHITNIEARLTKLEHAGLIRKATVTRLEERTAEDYRTIQMLKSQIEHIEDPTAQMVIPDMLKQLHHLKGRYQSMTAKFEGFDRWIRKFEGFDRWIQRIDAEIKSLLATQSLRRSKK